MTRGELRRAARRRRARIRAHNGDRLPPTSTWRMTSPDGRCVRILATEWEAVGQRARLGAGWDLERLTAEGWVRVRGARP